MKIISKFQTMICAYKKLYKGRFVKCYSEFFVLAFFLKPLYDMV